MKQSTKIEVGQIRQSKNYGNFVITEYVNADEVYVKFINTGAVSKASAGNIRSGLVRDNLAKTVYGVGCFGEGPFRSRHPNNGPCTKEYATWSGMMFRCYGDNRDETALRNYGDCTVAEEWYNFQNFAVWCQTQPEMNFPDMNLDKDILSDGCKIYSPETCCFVPAYISVAITGAKHMNTTGKAGVWKYKESYVVDITTFSAKQHLGNFEVHEKAEYVYTKVKEAYIHALADVYKDRLSERVFLKLKEWTCG